VAKFPVIYDKRKWPYLSGSVTLMMFAVRLAYLCQIENGHVKQRMRVSIVREVSFPFRPRSLPQI